MHLEISHLQRYLFLDNDIPKLVNLKKKLKKIKIVNN